VVVLRLLTADQPAPPGGSVTYLASVAASVAVEHKGLAPVAVDLADHPLRAFWARPGGPQALLDWARSHTDFGAAVQMRTWNLSTIWRLDTASGPLWLKAVPPFFAHEPAVLRWAATHDGPVPAPLAAFGPQMLLPHLPGDDLYGAGVDIRDTIAATMHSLQLASVSEVDSLAAAGVPDRRGALLVDLLQAAFASHPVVRRLPALVGQAADCGLPDVLVHGDLHPGNARGSASSLALLDWGDSFLGHPAFDIMTLTAGLSPSDSSLLLSRWASRWLASYPGSDPLRSVELLRPVAALRNALVYAGFLANIEPSEHPYHAGDVPHWLSVASSHQP
jgi:hypothetical protein